MPVDIGPNLALRFHLGIFLSSSSANSRRYDRAASVASMLRARIRKQAARNSRRRSSVLDQFAQSPASCGCAGGQTVSLLKSASGQKSCRAQEVNLGLIYLGITELDDHSSRRNANQTRVIKCLEIAFGPMPVVGQFECGNLDDHGKAAGHLPYWRHGDTGTGLIAPQGDIGFDWSRCFASYR